MFCEDQLQIHVVGLKSINSLEFDQKSFVVCSRDDVRVGVLWRVMSVLLFDFLLQYDAKLDYKPKAYMHDIGQCRRFESTTYHDTYTKLQPVQ